MSTSPIIHVVPHTGTAEREEPKPQPSDPAVGKWYWLDVVYGGEEGKETFKDDAGNTVKLKKGKKAIGKRLVCITRVGSNYVKVEGVGGETWRIHLNDFEKELHFEPEYQKFLTAHVENHRVKAAQLMAQVNEVTHQLGVGMGGTLLNEGQKESSAMVLASQGGADMKAYEKALVKAKDKQLPALFEEIKAQNSLMAKWMQAELIPLKAQANGLKPRTNAIEARIFNVKLYAGLAEEVKQVKEGKPAGMGEKLCIFQRRHYMDEECLLDYKAGGMDFRKLSEFDEWLSEERNFTRILPQPRCVVAFRIRHSEKDYSDGITNWRQFIQFALGEGEAYRRWNNSTFLYIRNGEQLFRLETEIDFGADLFPDMDKQKLLTGQLYARADHSNDKWDVITEHDYKDRRSKLAARLWKFRREILTLEQRRAEKIEEFKKAFEPFDADWRAWRIEAKKHGVGRDEKIKHPFERLKYKDDEGRKYAGSYWGSGDYDNFVTFGGWGYGDEREKNAEPGPDIRKYKVSMPKRPADEHLSQYEPWSRDNVYWDDIAKSIKDEMDRFNRIVLVIQGLFDRSVALHPHGQVKLFEEESFRRNVTLVYDDARALVGGKKPNFEAYRDACNKLITPGSITYGQEDFWEMKEAEKYNNDARRSRHGRDNHYEVKRHRPQGNPGPGELAIVSKVGPRTGNCLFKWERVREYSQYSWEYYERQKQKMREGQAVPCKLEVPQKFLFNISAYKPGDYKLFFADPRTRGEYLKWAPILLTAENFYAGKAKLCELEHAVEAVEKSRKCLKVEAEGFMQELQTEAYEKEERARAGEDVDDDDDFGDEDDSFDGDDD